MRLCLIYKSVVCISGVLAIILYLFCTPLGTCQTPGHDTRSSRIRGQVTDGDRNPLSDYVVEATSPPGDLTYAVKTKRNGTFAFPDLHEGVWSLRVKCDSVTLQQRELTLSEGEGAEVDFIIKGTGSVSGFLLDSVSRTPLPIDGDIEVGLRAKSGKRVVKSFRGQASGGSFQVSNLPPGRYVLIDAFYGYVFDMPEAPEVIVYPNSNVGGIEVLLKPGALVSGQFVDEDKQPISDLKVRVGSDKIHSVRPDRRSNSTYTRANGTFQLTIPNDPAEYYAFSVMIIDPRYQGKFFRRDLQPNQRDYDLGDITMRRVLSLTGKISDGTGKSVEGLEVQLRMHDKRGDFFRFAAQTQMELSTDSEGHFVLEELYPIEYSLTVWRGDVAVACLDAVNPGEKEHIDIRLESLWTLRGRVVDAQQQPIPGAQVRADRFPPRSGGHRTRLAATHTHPDGGFQLPVLKSDPARLSITVSKSGYFSRAYQNVRIERLVGFLLNERHLANKVGS